MAGRIAYFLVAGAAIVGGMVAQGDIRMDGDRPDGSFALAFDKDGDALDRRIDRKVDGRTDSTIDRRMDRGIDRESRAAARAGERALSDAIAELVRAEGSLITLKLDEQIPAAVVKQAEQRRNLAREAVERLADETRNSSRNERDAIRENIRDDIRDAVRG